MKICLDAGHGASEGHAYSGAHGNGLIEDDWALMFAGRLGHYLRAAGAETVFSRTEPHIVDIKERARIAKREKCDLFVSIHLNASSSATAHGCEAYIVPGDKRSQALAASVLGVVWQAGVLTRGVKNDNQSQHSSLTVLRNTYRAMPALLLEVGFLTNQKDAALLSDDRWVEDLAAAIARTICGVKG